MKFIKRLESTCDQIICRDNLRSLQKIVVTIAIAAFIINIFLIFLANQMGEPSGIWANIGTNYFASIFTPFGIILFFEVIVLIFALPKSPTRSIARQFEIISLIILFRVFKDVSELKDISKVVNDSAFIRDIAVDMIGSLILFALIALFYLTIRYQEKSKNISFEREDSVLTLKKKIITVVVAIIVAALALIFFGEWFIDLVGGTYRSFFNVQKIFFESVFTLLIFTDISIVLISYLLNDDYAIDFRNIGFIASIILIRFSLVAEKPIDILLAIFAFVFGVFVNISFTLFIIARNGAENQKR